MGGMLIHQQQGAFAITQDKVSIRNLPQIAETAYLQRCCGDSASRGFTGLFAKSGNLKSWFRFPAWLCGGRGDGPFHGEGKSVAIRGRLFGKTGRTRKTGSCRGITLKRP